MHPEQAIAPYENCRFLIQISLIFISKDAFNSLRPSDAYMRQ